MLKGMGISDGIGIGKAIILNNEDIKPEKIRTDDIEQEKKIFLDAIQSVKDETKNLISTLNGTEKDIMEAYLAILQDDTLVQETIKIIEQEKCNADYGADVGFNKIIQIFEQMDDPYMAARSRDIADMKRNFKYKRNTLIKFTDSYNFGCKRTFNIKYGKIRFKKYRRNYNRNWRRKLTYSYYGKNSQNTCDCGN